MAPLAPNGILVLNKPSGPTSHDCVARVRRALRISRVGHAGTLDPLASGVLVIGVGNGTRVLEYLQGLPKGYRAGIRLGLETDTQDVTGSPVAERDASLITEEQFRSGLARFQGEILQIPPMFSALKSGGRKLYDLARKGETVEREPRPVTVYAIEALAFTPGARAEGEFRARCSAGTYVRTLCHDLGGLLGCGGAMSSLVREAVGPFRLEEAVSLEELQPEMPLLPLAEALVHLPAVSISDAEAQRLGHGQFVPAPEDAADGPVRVLGGDGSLVAIATARGHGASRLLTPDKVFVSPDGR